MDKSVWLVEDVKGFLLGIFATKAEAEAFVTKSGANFTISEDSYC